MGGLNAPWAVPYVGPSDPQGNESTMNVDTEVTTLSAAFDDYPHTLPLKRGEIKSPRVAFTFSDVKPANRFFKPMVRELKFDVSEMAIATYVQAKAYGKPLVLIPATMMGRFQHGTILCRAARPITPADLPGKRVGVRSYSQTTAVWVRGILQNDYGVDVDRVRWVTFEDGHVAEYHEPAGIERVGGDKNLLEMLRQGELDAAIYGADLPKDPTLTSLIAEPEAAARKWFAQHKVVPINHMVVVTEKIAKSNPEAVSEIYRLLAQGKKAAGLPKAGEIDFLPFGFEACRPALQTVINYALQQSLIPRKIDVEELFDATTRALRS
jgi:4,5-dihydroxyphthalate decarboxylase